MSLFILAVTGRRPDSMGTAIRMVLGFRSGEGLMLAEAKDHFYKKACQDLPDFVFHHSDVGHLELSAEDCVSARSRAEIVNEMMQGPNDGQMAESS